MFTAPWLRWWLYCFKQNAEYKAYCNAKTIGDESVCADLEAKFERIAELYADWGDIQLVDANAKSASFNAWKAERKELFFRSHFVRWVDDPAAYLQKAGEMLIEVPLYDKQSDTIASVKAYIKYVYAGRDRAARLGTPKYRLAMQPLPPPKYVLHGDYNKATQGAVRKAMYVGMHQRIRKDGKPLSQADTVIAILQDPKNPFGDKWKMTEADKVKYAKGKLKKTVAYAGKIKQIQLYRAEFAALVRNTIYGRFPDFS